MISIVLLALAGFVFFGVDASKLKELYAQARERFTTKQIMAAALVVAAIAMLPWGSRETPPGPTPEPDNSLIDMEGLFVSPTASSDAALVGNLCLELADEIEWDGMQPAPLYTNGVQVDALRKAARILRCRGESIGERQPAARDAIAKYLEENVGVEGGPLTAPQRSAWVAAFREIGRAARDAAE